MWFEFFFNLFFIFASAYDGPPPPPPTGWDYVFFGFRVLVCLSTYALAALVFSRYYASKSGNNDANGLEKAKGESSGENRAPASSDSGIDIDLSFSLSSSGRTDLS